MSEHLIVRAMIMAAKTTGHALLAWLLVISWLFAVAAMVLVLSATPTWSEVCLAKPGKDDDDGREWRWRMIDNRRCWYQSQRALPKTDLIWEYDGAQFDSDGVVRERKFYSPEELAR